MSWEWIKDNHVNTSGSFTKDTQNPKNIFKAGNTHNDKEGTNGKENIAGRNTVTDQSERETDESIIDHENDQLNSSFTEALNHEKEKRELLINVKV